MGMIRINLYMDMPKECHECPFQLKFKDGEADAWYMRRCVIMQRKIEYPRPEWCPLEYVSEGRESVVRCKDCIHKGKVEKCVLAAISEEKNCPLFMLDNYGEWFCADGKGGETE